MLHEHLSINTRGKDYVIGDLHGCYDVLQEKLAQISFNKDQDRLFSVGDLIDRGPDSLKCLQLIDEKWFHPVMGNHEKMMLDTILRKEDPAGWIINGGEWAQDADVAELHRLAKLVDATVPYAITVDTGIGAIGICHAEPPTLNWDDVTSATPLMQQIMLWSRTKVKQPIPVFTNNVVKTIHGHTPMNAPHQTGNAIFIDTGCVFGGGLTVIQL